MKFLRAKLCNSVGQKRNARWFIHQWREFKRWQDLDRASKEYKEEQWRVKNWMKLESGFYISPEVTEDVLPKKPFADQTRKDVGAIPMEFLTNLTQCRYTDHSIDNIRRTQEYKYFQKLQYDQRFLSERYLFLGADLAAAFFIVHRGGTVKFVNNDTWFKKDKRGRYTLPGQKTIGWYLEAIDASNTELMYEGFDNLYDLNHLRLLSLANCPYVDDWVLSRIGGIFGDSLEMLDLSNCKRISAKGLMGLRSLTKLRFLRLEGLNHVEGIAKCALMLEDAIQNLVVLGLDYDKALDSLDNERRLLKDSRILLDAKGNAFVEDDNGRLFYVKGNVNERATVDDEDTPIVQSLIKRELPAMDDAEFERLDKMSKGKLRHFLVGSPSGLSWTQDVETILSFEYEINRWERIPTAAKMLPKARRRALLQLDDGAADLEQKIGNRGEEEEQPKRIEATA